MSKQLQIIKGPDKGKIFSLAEGVKLLLGRSRKTQDPLSDRNVSRAHCQVKVEGDRVVLTDLDSHAGTFVNGQRVKEHDLQPGDIIGIGQTQIRFQAPGEDGGAEAAAAIPTETVVEALRKPVVPLGTVIEPPKKQAIPTETIIEPPKKPAIHGGTIVEPPRKPGLHPPPIADEPPEPGPVRKTDTVVEMHPPRVEGRDRGRLNPEAAPGLRLHWVWLVVGVLVAFLAGVALTWILTRG